MNRIMEIYEAYSWCAMMDRILLHDTTLYYPSSPLFLEGLEELSPLYKFKYHFFDEGNFLSRQPSLLHRIAHRFLGRSPLPYWSYNRALLDTALTFCPEVILIVKGPYISPKTLLEIKNKTKAFLINYATDDPFNPKNTTKDLIDCIPLYDLYVSTKQKVMKDIRSAGAKQVAYHPFAYKPSVHFPEHPKTLEEKKKFESDVVFIGGCDEDRIPYFKALVQAFPNIKLHLYGGYWNKHKALRPYYRGYVFGREFRLALGGAKIALNLVRRANRDGHVMRTFEIPACGAFMLAERTEEHLKLLKEDKEAVYFDSPKEMIEKIAYYLLREKERQNIAKAGYSRVINNENTYRDRLLQILREVPIVHKTRFVKVNE